MFHCASSFQRYTRTIRRVWEWRFNTMIGKWDHPVWWAGSVFILGFLVSFPIIAVSQALNPFPYFREVYCPRVGDCIPFLRPHWPLPAWAWFHLLLLPVWFLSSLSTQWGYRRGRWCLAWWGYLVYYYVFFSFLAFLFAGLLFVGLSGAPEPTALVGYSTPIIYTLWYFSVQITSVRPLWRGERPDLRPPLPKLQAGLGSTAVFLGIAGVALGRILYGIPPGKWGFVVMGLIGFPALMYESINHARQELLVLAPWRIVLEAEASREALEETA